MNYWADISEVYQLSWKYYIDDAPAAKSKHNEIVFFYNSLWVVAHNTYRLPFAIFFGYQIDKILLLAYRSFSCAAFFVWIEKTDISY